MKTMQELENYKQDIETAYQPCRVLTANQDTTLNETEGQVPVSLMKRELL